MNNKYVIEVNEAIYHGWLLPDASIDDVSTLLEHASREYIDGIAVHCVPESFEVHMLPHGSLYIRVDQPRDLETLNQTRALLDALPAEQQVRVVEWLADEYRPLTAEDDK